MTKAKHTPGPWNVAKTTFGQTIIDAPSIGEIVCRVEEWSEKQDEANARLIAAAPELLDALKLVVQRCGPNSTDGAIARAAIAKAEG